MSKGFFLTLEGPDGAGKGTILNYVEDMFLKEGLDFILTKEPGSPKSEVCKMMRDFVLNPNYNVMSEAEVFMYMADRCQHVNEVVRPALEANKIVLCDRYIDSTYAYQGWGRRYGKPEDLENINFLNRMSTGNLVPDMTIILLVQPEIGLQRIKKSKGPREFGEDYDRIEKEELDFHKRVHKGYTDLLSVKVKGDRNIVAFDTTHTDQETCWNSLQPVLREELKKRGLI